MWTMQASTCGHGLRLHRFGWIEYQPPGGTIYYVHPTRRITADLDLRDDKVLDSVNRYFEHPKDGRPAPVGMELWLREGESGKQGFRPVRHYLVNHEKKAVSPSEDDTYWDGRNMDKETSEDDRECFE